MYAGAGRLDAKAWYIMRATCCRVPALRFYTLPEWTLGGRMLLVEYSAKETASKSANHELASLLAHSRSGRKIVLQSLWPPLA